MSTESLKQTSIFLNPANGFCLLNPRCSLKKSETLWANYLLGVAAQYKNAGYKLEGVDCVFGGDIPLGAGLSSSAAPLLPCSSAMLIYLNKCILEYLVNGSSQ